MHSFKFLLIVTLCVPHTFTFYNSEHNTLQLVFALFRHGDRTKDPNTTFPKDPQANETYFPYGLGELTNKGKRREFLLGKKIRSRYNDFLGKIYSPEVIEAFATESRRAKMSLELVLAALYPPTGTPLDWSSGANLNWQPIPYKELQYDSDHLMSFPLFFCKNYPKVYDKFMKTPEGELLISKYSKAFSFLSKHTGMDVKTFYDLFVAYFTLKSDKEWGYELPAWSRKYYPEFLENGVIDFYISSTATPKLNQLSGGFFLRRVLNITLQKITHTMEPPSRKMFLYSGHEINIANLLNAMNVYYRHIPPYGACIFLELHKMDNVYGFKVFYEDHSGPQPKQLIIPGCGDFCPFKKFVRLLQDNITPRDDLCDNENAV